MIRVTCAVIRNEDEEVLVVQRGESTDHPFKWEFPGGKLAKNESEEECIIREVKEELSMDIVICRRLSVVEHDYGHKKILLIPFICDTLDDLPFLSEHISYKWIDFNELKSIDFCAADVFVADNYLSEINPDSENELQTLLYSQPVLSDDTGLQGMIGSMMSSKEAEWIATSAIDNPAIFNKLLEYSYSSDKRLAFHSSWTLTKVCDRFPELIYPYLPKIVETLDKLDNESARRSFLRIISLTEIDRLSNKQHGILAELCFTALKSGFSAVAIKAYSMEILYKLVLKYPELLNEFSATVKMIEGEGSAGIIARGRIIMKKLGNTPLKPSS
jgi:8-oxo-dGTP diphosphatase